MDTYDPSVHVTALRYEVRYTDDLHPDEDGLTVPEDSIIWLRSGMTLIEQRSVLAHECVHAEHADQPTRLTHLKLEHRADLTAATRLIDIEWLADLMHWRPDSPHAWCTELRVTPHLLVVRLGALRAASTA